MDKDIVSNAVPFPPQGGLGKEQIFNPWAERNIIAFQKEAAFFKPAENLGKQRCFDGS